MKIKKDMQNSMKYRPSVAILSLMAIFTLWNNLAYGQTKPYTEEVTVVARYVPTIGDANKINFSPKAEDTVMPKPDFSYGIKSTLIPTTYSPEPIEPAKMAGEPIQKLTDNYLKAGYGNYNSPYLELYHNNSRSKDFNYGFSATHFSSAGKIKGYGFPGYSNSDVQVFTRKNWDKKSTLNASLGFNHEVVHYYGYKEADFDTLPSKDDTKQRFNTYDLKTSWKTAETDSSHIGQELKLKGYYLNDLYKNSEFGLGLEHQIGQHVKWLKISPSQEWKMESGFEFHGRKTDTLKTYNTWMLQLKPTFAAELGGLGVKIGVNAQIAHDTTTDLSIYPMVEVKGELIPGSLSFVAGIDGYTKEYAYRDLITVNPFLSPLTESSFARTTYRFYGGIRAKLAKTIDLNVEASQSHTEEMPFFVNDYSDVYHNKFYCVYDNVDLFRVKAEVAYHLGSRIEISDAFEWKSFSMKEQEKPWHVPAMTNTFTFSYNIQDKIFVKFDFIYYSQMYALNDPAKITEDKVITLDARPDLNLGLEYKYSKLIGAFLNVNNIANKNYPLWNNYPSKGINVLAGLSFSF